MHQPSRQPPPLLASEQTLHQAAPGDELAAVPLGELNPDFLGIGTITFADDIDFRGPPQIGAVSAPLSADQPFIVDSPLANPARSALDRRGIPPAQDGRDIRPKS